MTNAEIYRALGPEFARDYDAARPEWRAQAEAAVGAARGARSLSDAVGVLARLGWGHPEELAAEIRRTAGVMGAPPFSPDACPPCPDCGGAYTVTAWPDDGEGPMWSAECASCHYEWTDLTEPPSWRMLAKGNRQIAALVEALVAAGRK